MKKIIILPILLVILSGCRSTKKEINCVYEDNGDTLKSYMHITLTYDEKTILTEKLDAVYQFATKEDADANYKKIEEVLEKDETVTIKQDDDLIEAQGEKDVSLLNYEKDAKVAYYEELGYTCE